MDEALGCAEQAVKDCLSTSAHALSPQALVESLDRVQALSHRVLALQLALVREADARSLAVEHGAAGTAAWLRDRWRISGPAASRLVKLASVLSTRPGLAAALADGVVNAEQAGVVSAGVARLPVVQQDDGERFLLEQADVLGPRELGRLGERLFEVLDPGRADRLAGQSLEREERRA